MDELTILERDSIRRGIPRIVLAIAKNDAPNTYKFLTEIPLKTFGMRTITSNHRESPIEYLAKWVNEYIRSVSMEHWEGIVVSDDIFEQYRAFSRGATSLEMDPEYKTKLEDYILTKNFPIETDHVFRSSDFSATYMTMYGFTRPFFKYTDYRQVKGMISLIVDLRKMEKDATTEQSLAYIQRFTSSREKFEYYLNNPETVKNTFSKTNVRLGGLPEGIYGKIGKFLSGREIASLQRVSKEMSEIKISPDTIDFRNRKMIYMTDEDVERLFKNYKPSSVTKVIFPRYDRLKMTIQSIDLAIKTFGNLEKIDIGSIEIPPNYHNRVLSEMKNLFDVSVGDKGIGETRSHLFLDSLNKEKVIKITIRKIDNLYTPILIKFSNLTVLRIVGRSRDSYMDDDFKDFFQVTSPYLPLLSKISIEDADINFEGIENFNSLDTLELKGVELQQDDDKWIAASKTLRRLIFKSNIESDSDFMNLTDSGNITEISYIKDLLRVGNYTALKYLTGNMQTLRKITVSDGDALGKISLLPNLVELTVYYPRNLELEGTRLTKLELLNAGTLRQKFFLPLTLEYLKIKGNMKAKTLGKSVGTLGYQIQRMPGLKTLIIEDNSGLEVPALQFLSSMTSLVELRFIKCKKINGEILQYLHRLDNLETLVITGLTDMEIEEFKTLHPNIVVLR